MNPASAITTVGVELAGLLVVFLLAGISPGMGSIAVTFMLGLMLVWGMTHIAAIKTAGSAVTSAASNNVTATNSLSQVQGG